MNWSPCPWENLEELSTHTQNHGHLHAQHRGSHCLGAAMGPSSLMLWLHFCCQGSRGFLLWPGFTYIVQAKELQKTRANETKSTQHKTTAAGLGHLCGGGSMEEGSGQWVG